VRVDLDAYVHSISVSLQGASLGTTSPEMRLTAVMPQPAAGPVMPQPAAAVCVPEKMENGSTAAPNQQQREGSSYDWYCTSQQQRMRMRAGHADEQIRGLTTKKPVDFRNVPIVIRFSFLLVVASTFEEEYPSVILPVLPGGPYQMTTPG
jgi:hypothetical protein